MPDNRAPSHRPTEQGEGELCSPWSRLAPEQRLGLMLAGYAILHAAIPQITVVPRPVSDVLFCGLTVGLAAFVVFELCGLALGGPGEWAKLAGAAFFLWAFSLGGLLLSHGFLGSVVVANVCQLVFAGALGGLFASLLPEAKLIPPVAVTVVLIDWIGVNYGFVGRMLEQRPELVTHMAQAIPVAGSALASAGAAPRVLATVGLGDWLFIAFFLSAAKRFSLNERPTLYAMLGLTLVGLWTVILTDVALPGLPFIAGAALLCNLRHFRYTRQEKIALLYGALFLAALAAAYYLGSLRFSAGEEVPKR